MKKAEIVHPVPCNIQLSLVEMDGKIAISHKSLVAEHIMTVKQATEYLVNLQTLIFIARRYNEEPNY